MNAKSAKDDEYDEELDDEESYDDDFDDDEDEEFDDDFEDDEALEEGEEPEEEDPTWWVPYGVLGLILFIGLLGFFGAFNKVLGFLAAPVDVQSDAHASATTVQTAQPAAPQPKPLKMPPAAKGDFFGAKHILVMYKGSKRAPSKISRTKEEALKRAREAGKRAKKGEKFEELVKEYSDEPGAGARGGNLGRFRKGTMVPQFQAAVEKLKVGQISDPVETPFGYHIIVRTQ